MLGRDVSESAERLEEQTVNTKSCQDELDFNRMIKIQSLLSKSGV